MNVKLTVAVCGSMSFESEMYALGDSLVQLGFQVHLPERGDSGTDWGGSNLEELRLKKRQYIDNHLQNIRASDLVLIANFEKRAIVGYIGANTLMEAAFAYSLSKPVILLNYPGEQYCQLEILSIATQILRGEINELINDAA